MESGCWAIGTNTLFHLISCDVLIGYNCIQTEPDQWQQTNTNLVWDELFRGNKNVFAYPKLYQYWDGAESINSFFWNIRMILSYIGIIMAADVLATQFYFFLPNILPSASDGSIHFGQEMQMAREMCKD